VVLLHEKLRTCVFYALVVGYSFVTPGDQTVGMLVADLGNATAVDP
jgi:hypothetical protein